MAKTTPQLFARRPCGQNTRILVSASALGCAVALASTGCGSASSEGLYGEDFTPLPPPSLDAGSGAAPGSTATGVPVALGLSSAALDQLQVRLSAARAQGAAELRSEHEPSFGGALGYSAVAAAGLERIQSSHLSLTGEELAHLAQQGFVILPRQQYPSFPYAYTEIYAQDLPVFVSADMVLEAVHRSYDSILERLEQELLVPRLSALLARLRERLAASDFAADAELGADLDLFLTVGLRLLDGSPAAPVRGADAQRVAELVNLARAASGTQSVQLFGRARDLDFSQFAPRGHYADSDALSQYFRAMIWFGRTDLRLIETQGDGSRLFLRRQLDAALALRELMDEGSLAEWAAIDGVIGAFVGEHDYMTVPELGALLADLGVQSRSALAGLPDARIAQAIVDGRYGDQRILSQVMMKQGGAASPLPLDSSFALFGQRYVVDSHVFSNVVYDRVSERILPSSLDVAFAALGNDQALPLIGAELEQADYPGALSALRTLVDAQAPVYWSSSLYNAWLGALRELSPNAPSNALPGAGLPSLARSDAWGRRLLNTQLASWAQLRHDTVLYAKQSYTTGSLCEYPDALIDPYPEFFRALARYADLGQSTLDSLGPAAEGDLLLPRLHDYFATLSSVMSRLARMADAQRSGAPHDADDIAFINQAITLDDGCAGKSGQSGWYEQLYFDDAASIQQAPTIADVHTDPGGQFPISRGPSVLHVAAGLPQLMVLAVDSCSGPRAYVGAVSDYQEHVNAGLHRFSDAEWSEMVAQGIRWQPSWMAPTRVSE